MKKTILFLILIHCTLLLPAHGWEWQKVTEGTRIVKDHLNNVYVLSQQSTTLNIRKFDITGTFIWSKNITGSLTLSACKVDQYNYLVLAGNLTGPAYADTKTLTPAGIRSAYLMRIDPSASVHTATVFGNTQDVFVNDLFITANGDYLLAGGYHGSFSIGAHQITGDSYVNGFIVRMDYGLNVLWSERTMFYDGGESCFIDEIVETASGKYYMLLTFVAGLIEFNGHQFSESTGQYIVQLDASRKVQWKKMTGYPGLTFNVVSDLQTSGDTVYVKEQYSHHGVHSKIILWNETGTSREITFGVYNLAYQVANGKVYYAYATNHETGKDSRNVGILTTNLITVAQITDSLHFPPASQPTRYDEMQVIDDNSLYLSGFGDEMSQLFVGKFNYGSPTAVGTMEPSAEISVYPVPCADHVTVRFAPGMNAGRILVSNTLGQTLITRQVAESEQSIEVDVTQLPPGIYHISSASGSFLARIVRQ